LNISEAKELVEISTGISSDAYHVILSVVVQLAAAAIFRRSVAHPLPWLAVLILECLNEWNDLRAEAWPERSMQWSESAQDLLLTMLLPTILILSARYCPRLFQPPRGLDIVSEKTNG
jgi:hypothetical protein